VYNFGAAAAVEKLFWLSFRDDQHAEKHKLKRAKYVSNNTRFTFAD